MGIEIERKFLVCGSAWRAAVERVIPIRQGYLSSGEGKSVRVRLTDQHAWLTIKGGRSGLVRQEFEYAIPVEDAHSILVLCGDAVVTKTRYCIPAHGVLWEVDEFSGANEGLIVAEIELMDPDQSFSRPDWLGKEVSHDSRYLTSRLAQHPYTLWPEKPLPDTPGKTAPSAHAVQEPK